MKLKIIVFLIIFTLELHAQSQTRIIAHRGFWKTEGSAQNSIAALRSANEIDVYGSEVDVWLSSDEVPVVNHDASVMLNGEKLIVQDSPVNLLRKVKLSNGESLPTPASYLDAFDNCNDIKLIIEFKKHRTKCQEDELVEKVLKMVHDKDLQNRVEYISFGLNLVFKTIQLNSMAKVYYLEGDLSPNVMKEIGAAGIDYHLSVLKYNPQWIKESHDLGLKVNVWTVNTPEDIKHMIDLNVDFITTDKPLMVKEILNKLY